MIYFYVSKEYWTPSIDKQANWENLPEYKDGVYCWILQTYYRLLNVGVDCSIGPALPTSGIIISHKACLPNSFKPSKTQLLVCIAADWGRHPFAQVNIVQNPMGIRPEGINRSERYLGLGKNIYIRHWPQAGIIPRDKSRADALTTIAYIGRKENLAIELKSEKWNQFLSQKGIKWLIVDDPEKWHDYSLIDATISIRDFSGNLYPWKPASKLFNSWKAGVIPICAAESSFTEERQKPEECFIAHSMDQLHSIINELHSDQTLVKNSFKASINRSQDVSFEAITKDWEGILKNDLSYEYEKWIAKTSFQRAIYYAKRLPVTIFKQIFS
jgi:hypothetical protein